MCIARLSAILAALLSLSGCATLNEAQCGSGDWFGIGAADARGGYTADRLALHEKACAKYALATDPEPYYAGYREGLVSFCVPTEAFLLGRRGAGYFHQCPAEIERDFIPAYDLGSDVHAVEQDLARIDIEIAQLREEVDDADDDVAREGAGQRLDYAKDERDRREYDRSTLLARARERGYSDGW